MRLFLLKKLAPWIVIIGVTLFSYPVYIQAQAGSTLLGFLQMDVKVEKPIFTSWGKSMVYLGHRITHSTEDKVQLTIFFHCLDRTGDSVSLGFRLESLIVGAQVRDKQEDTSGWQIGEVVGIHWDLDLASLPLGTYQLYVDYGNQSEFLERINVYHPKIQESLQEWRFFVSEEVWDLGDALIEAQNIGFLLPNTIMLACQEAPGPGNKVGVVYRKKIVPHKRYRVKMEMNDSYGSSGMEGNIEQRVYLNDELVFRHDIGGVGADGRTYGWYEVDVPFETALEYVDVKVEVVPLRALGPWGWGAASRTQIRHVTIVAE